MPTSPSPPVAVAHPIGNWLDEKDTSLSQVSFESNVEDEKEIVSVGHAVSSNIASAISPPEIDQYEPCALA